MELEISDKRENPLLDRTEVHFVVHHPNQPSPRREHVREALSNELNVKKELVIVDNLRSSFGVHDTKGYAKIYSKKEVALKVERAYLIKRNNLQEQKAKEKKQEPGEEKSEEPAEAKKEEPVKPKKAKKEESVKPEKAKKKDSSEPKKASDEKQEEPKGE